MVIWCGVARASTLTSESLMLECMEIGQKYGEFLCAGAWNGSAVSCCLLYSTLIVLWPFLLRVQMVVCLLLGPPICISCMEKL